MLFDATLSGGVPADLTADLVIIGAGTVGLFLASVMAEARPSLNVVVVEAGGKVPGTDRNIVSSASIGRRHEGVILGRAAGLGGTSSLWGGQLAEFDEADLSNGDAGWPISYSELQELYLEVYKKLDVGHPAPVESYRKKFGDESAGDGAIERFFTYWLREPNFATRYQKMIRGNSSVRVIVNLTANGITFEGDNARSLRCSAADDRQINIHAPRFVFTSGTISTSRFFLSTQRSDGVPWAANNNVGKYFHDHLGGKIASVQVTDEVRFRDFFENGWVDGIKLQPKLALSRRRGEVFRSGACGIFTFDSSISENLTNLKRMVRGIKSAVSFSSASSRANDILAVGRALIPIATRYIKHRRIFAVFDRGVKFNVQAEQIPISRSRVKLRDGVQLSDGLYPIALDWQCDGEELDAIYHFAIESDVYLRRHKLAKLTIDPALLRKDRAFMETLGDTYHQSGGMRMSTSPATGVVDRNGRVWGTGNVWASGPSVLPSSSHANCTLTGLAMAMRLSRHLSESWKS